MALAGLDTRQIRREGEGGDWDPNSAARPRIWLSCCVIITLWWASGRDAGLGQEDDPEPRGAGLAAQGSPRRLLIQLVLVCVLYDKISSEQKAFPGLSALGVTQGL